MEISAIPGIKLRKKMYCQLRVSVMKPPTAGPIDGANVAVIPNIASPIGCLDLGSMVRMVEKLMGMSTPPVKPCAARHTIMVGRSCANPHNIEKIMNKAALKVMYTRRENTWESQPVRGIVTISAMRYAVEIQ